MLLSRYKSSSQMRRTWWVELEKGRAAATQRGRNCKKLKVSCGCSQSVPVVMKVQCDVCKGDEEAAVFCCADEAALCSPCDARVHSANKLAGKHRRYALHPAASPHQLPLCDICKEKRAFLFCQEDRAILCRNCDAGIHDANDLTRKHTRFLLTGIKISHFSAAAAASEATSSSDSRPSSVVASSATTATSPDEGFPRAINGISQRSRHGGHGSPKQRERPAAGGNQMTDHKKSKMIATVATGFRKGKMAAAVEDKGPCSSANGTGGGSSISEYLMKDLPGWHFEDLLLDPSCPPIHSATFVESLTPFRETDLDDAAVAAGVVFPAEDSGKLPATWCVPWVPRFSLAALPAAPPGHDYHNQRQHQQQQGLAMKGFMGGELTTQSPARQLQHHRWTADDCFSFPDLVAVHHHTASYKRPRPAF